MAKGKGKSAGDFYKPPKWKRGGRSTHKHKTFSPYPIAHTNTPPLDSPFVLKNLPTWALADGRDVGRDVISTPAGDINSTQGIDSTQPATVFTDRYTPEGGVAASPVSVKHVNNAGEDYSEAFVSARVVSSPVQPSKPKLKALFTGTAVHVVDVAHATILYQQGCFGKGDQSRGHASWMPDIDAKRFNNNRNAGTRTPGGSGRATPTTKAYSNKEAVSDAKTDVTTAVDGTKHAEPRKAKCLPPSDTLYAYTSDLGGLQSGDNSTSQPGGDTDMRTIEDRKFEQYKHTVGRIADDLGAHAVVPTENEAGCAVSTKTGHQSQDTVETGHVQSLVAGTGAVEKALIRAGDIVEREVLGLEETFYLVYGLQCLDLYREGNETPMTIQDVWTAFCTLHAAFIPRYTVYHHYRACGWVPRSGLKYATDFVLYKMGPIFTHSSYNVLIRTENAPEGFGQGLAWMSRQEGWGKIQNLQRMTEGVAKDTVLAWVLFPTTFDCTTPECLGQLQVDEYIIRRWRPEGT